MNYSFDFASVFRNFDPLWDGLLVTVELTIAANAIGLTLGFALALLVMSRWRAIRLPVTLFIEFFRCTPAIIQIVWFFYCVPMLFNVFLGSVTMGVLALGLDGLGDSWFHAGNERQHRPVGGGSGGCGVGHERS